MNHLSRTALLSSQEFYFAVMCRFGAAHKYNYSRLKTATVLPKQTYKNDEHFRAEIEYGNASEENCVVNTHVWNGNSTSEVSRKSKEVKRAAKKDHDVPIHVEMMFRRRPGEHEGPHSQEYISSHQEPCECQKKNPPVAAGPVSGADEDSLSLSDGEECYSEEEEEEEAGLLAWDADLAGHCERVTLVTPPRLPAPLAEQARTAGAAAETELERLAGACRLSAALRLAAALAAAGTPPPFGALCRLAEAAARRGSRPAFERCRRLAARLYPGSLAAAGRLRHAELELLWRRRQYGPAVGLLLRRRREHPLRQLMARRFAVCCCLSAEDGADDALPHIQRGSEELMQRGAPDALLSAWQHCALSERHSYQQAGVELLQRQPAARRHLAPYLLAVVQQAQLTGREDVLRRLPELVLTLGQHSLYPLVFGALLDFQCLVEDVQSAQETFKMVNEMSIRLPSTVVERYSSLLQRHRLRAPAALLRMKYRERPPDGSAVSPTAAPPPPAWWDKW